MDRAIMKIKGIGGMLLSENRKLWYGPCN